ncbi:ATP-binding protein [Rhizobium ruizarguesonis]|uniref:ATP-binding protein n=1 Tax=Rhizobium ruizarguesonis TaxID=2081791 RepID=UPI00103144B4|nr:ATP-binding protein [Rhizobium ruizarguesonis]TAW73051.1 ATP-binding protein [Rhizobium ruizarguesonis]
MVESLRGMGYSISTAIADIVDNSISAGANVVNVKFHWRGPDSAISIMDNGSGMVPLDLERAMRLGDKDPSDDRSLVDLGRFGLGLKTASFSQARRLTVRSKRDDTSETLRWDLDLLRADPQGRWLLLEGCEPGSEHFFAALEPLTRGTLVLWEVLDRVVPPGSSDNDFLQIIDRVEQHLSMVFHRFLERRSIDIKINDVSIKPWDPFLRSRADTWRSGENTMVLDGHRINFEGFVLPHKDRLPPKIYDESAGPDGWTAQQGFYVYRNERLLVAGNWLGLGRGRSWTKEEPFRLARIRLDIPNTADEDWKIDIRKSIARPPHAARPRLSIFAEDVRQRARRVFAFRGKSERRSSFGPIAPVWEVERLKNGMRYRVDQTHPAIAAVLEHAGDLKQDVIAMLRVIEETVPVQQIWLDTAEAKETPKTGFDGAPPEEVRSVMQTVFNNLVNRKGLSEEQARRHLATTDPFDNWPSFLDTMTASRRT